MKGKTYKQSRESSARAVSALFEEPAVCFENGQTVWRALTDYRKAPGGSIGGKSKFADFADALILNKSANWIGDSGDSMDGLVTFDQVLLELPGALQP